MREKIEVGEVLHVARSGRMIIKSIGDVAGLSRGTILVDAKGRSVAEIIELIGPVQSPYISAMPLTDRVKKYVGATLYVEKASKKVRRQRDGEGKSKSKGKRVERRGRREMMREKREEDGEEEEGGGKEEE
ncbi:hypothetical protein HRbin04_01213 [archaeon HR04]|nr:hypothetical protein HRbin04_01213 [archaeon HR04]